MLIAIIDKYPLTYKFPLAYTAIVKKEIINNGHTFVGREKTELKA